MITREEALELFHSDDLIGVGMEADRIRRQWHPEGVVSYIIDRNINYTNFCTEYCSFCAFYRPLGHAEGYIHSHQIIFDKIQETIDLGGTGILIVDGLGQTGGVIMFISGFAFPKTELVRNDLGSVRVLPLVGKERTGLSLVGSF